MRIFHTETNDSRIMQHLMQRLLHAFLLLYALIVKEANVIAAENSTTVMLEQAIHNRMIRLRRIGMMAHQSSHCSETKFLFLRGTFGRSGNNVIQVTHMLWMSKVLNRTLLIPQVFNSIFQAHDLSALHTAYCFKIANGMGFPNTVEINWNHETRAVYTTADLSNADLISVGEGESFFLFRLFSLKSLLPPLTKSVIDDISETFVSIYALLWGSVQPNLYVRASHIIENYLAGELSYTSAHKRSLEGTCDLVLQSNVQPSSLSPLDIPQSGNPEWEKHQVAALCSMRLSFIQATQLLHHQQNQKIYLASDGSHDMEYMSASNAVLLQKIVWPSELGSAGIIDEKYLDMFVAIHARLFVLNPRSTVSWIVFVVRAALGLQSVPIPSINDMFLMKLPQEFEAEGRTIEWVSWASVLKASARLSSLLDSQLVSPDTSKARMKGPGDRSPKSSSQNKLKMAGKKKFRKRKPKIAE